MILVQAAAGQSRVQKRNALSDSIAWVPQTIPIPGVVAGDAIFFDYDNDGRLDILMAGVSENDLVSGVYRNDSANGFVNIEANLIPLGSERGMTWGDFDNDGDYDIAIEGNASPGGGYTPASRIYRNDNGSYNDIHAPIMDLQGGSVSWVDYNNDGRLELFLCGSNDIGNSFYAKLYKQIDSTFVEDPAFLPGVWGSSVGWADYDRDGDLDLVISGYGWGMQTLLFRNDLIGDSSQTFVEIPAPVGGMYQFEAVSSSGVAWFDYDNDGWPDLLVTGGGYGGPAAKIYHNDQNGTFHDIGAALLPVSVSAVAVGDYDNDGYLDIAISGAQDFTFGSNPTTKIYRNVDGTFNDIGANLVGTWFGSLEWGDYDKDGRLDLLVTGATIPRDSLREEGKYLKPVTVLYRNTVVVDSNGAPSLPSGLGAGVVERKATLSWAASSDVETPQQAISYNLRIGTSPGGIDVLSPLSNTSTGFRRAPRFGNAGVRTSAVIRNLPPGTYYWSVQSVDNQFAASGFSPEKTFTITSNSVVDPSKLPSAYSLRQNYPNPFNPTTRIAFELPASGKVSIEVFDVLGRSIARLIDGWMDAGSHAIEWRPEGRSSGVYYYRLRAGTFTETRTMLLVR